MRGRFRALVGLLTLAMLASLLLGYQSVSLSSLWQLSEMPALQHLLLTYRLPRMLIAPICGAALAVAGSLLQTISRNPLAAPDVLGINAAASMAVVVGLFCLPGMGLGWLNLLAFMAAMSMMLLLLGVLSVLPARAGLLPLPLLGTVLAMLFSAVTQTLITLDPATQDQALGWLTGNIAGRELAQLWAALPWLGGGVWLVWRLLPSLDLFALGNEQIRALGQEPRQLQYRVVLAASLLVAGVVGVVGPIGFIGLLIPHLARRCCPHGQRGQLAMAALLGALVLTLADVAARFVLFPDDIPVGAVTALIGGPLFLWLLYRVSRSPHAF